MPAMGEKRCFDRVATISGLAPSADVRTGFHQYTTTLKHLQQTALFHQPRPPCRPKQVAKVNGVTSGGSFEVEAGMKIQMRTHGSIPQASHDGAYPEAALQECRSTRRADLRFDRFFSSIGMN